MGRTLTRNVGIAGEIYPRFVADPRRDRLCRRSWKVAGAGDRLENRKVLPCGVESLRGAIIDALQATLEVKQEFCHTPLLTTDDGSERSYTASCWCVA
jgi:hypothetical protein